MQEIAIGVSLPVQSNSAVAEFDVFSAEIGQARFRMEGGVGETSTELLEKNPTLPSPKTGRDEERSVSIAIASPQAGRGK